jgi:hypothetical protein
MNLTSVSVNAQPVSPWSRRDVQIGAAVAIALALAFVLWLLLRGGGGHSNNAPNTSTGSTTVSAIGPKAVDVSALRSFAAQSSQPVYWIGPESNRVYELTRTTNGRIFVRYLPPSAKIGTKHEYPFVGTYSVTGAYTALKTQAAKDHDVTFNPPGGALAAYSASQPTNVYLAYPGSNVQIEVFDPSPDHARALVASGQVTPVR